jgi:hypothetical protein
MPGETAERYASLLGRTWLKNGTAQPLPPGTVRLNHDGRPVNAQGQVINTALPSGNTPAGSSGGGSGTNNNNAAINAANMAAYKAALAKPHGLAQGYSTNTKINWNDKGSDGKKMDHLETFDEQLSHLKGVLTLAKKWIAPKAPTLLSTETRIDPYNEHGGGAAQGDRQDSQSDRNSSNYSGPGPSNPTNQSSGVGKTGKKNKGGSGSGRASDPGSGGSASN